MVAPALHEAPQLLWRNGDEWAIERLTPLVGEAYLQLIAHGNPEKRSCLLERGFP